MKIQNITKIEKVNRQICKADGSSNPKCNDGVCAVTGLNEHFEYVHVGCVCHSFSKRTWTLRDAKGNWIKKIITPTLSINKQYDTKAEAVHALVHHVNNQ